MMRRAASHTHKHYRFTGLPLWQAGFGSTLGMSIDGRVQVPHASLMAGTLGLMVHTDMYIYAG